jgi:hypothetical protein
MIRLELEYVMNCSPKVLFNRLSTASGLAEWFADDVSVNSKKFTFVWDGTERIAELTFIKENLLVRFEWKDGGGYFEFKITRDELTGDVSLLVVDMVDDSDVEGIKAIWDSQVAILRHVVGS